MARLTKQTYSEQVAQLVRQRIRSGQLTCGDSVAEAALAEECGISRGPVREALCVLEGEGLLADGPRGGKCVRVLTPRSVCDNYQVSALLEGAVASEVPEAEYAPLCARLERLLQKMEEAVAEDGSFEAHASLGSQFHETILATSTNATLRKLASGSSRIISKYLLYRQWRKLYTPEELLQRHRRIYEAIVTRDKQLIRDTICAHYAESASRLACYCPESD